MRFFCLILLFAALSFSFKTDNSSNYTGMGEQVGPIKMGYTTIEEARDTLGITARIQNDKYFGVRGSTRRVCTKGIYYEYSLVDSAKGISMKAQCKKLHVIDEIQLTSPCKWKVGKGFSIGMSFDEIKTKFGQPTDEVDTTLVPDSNRGLSQYHQMSYGNITLCSLHKMNEEGGCCVDLIIIYCSEVYRPHAGKYYRAIIPARCPRGCVKC